MRGEGMRYIAGAGIFGVLAIANVAVAVGLQPFAAVPAALFALTCGINIGALIANSPTRD